MQGLAACGDDAKGIQKFNQLVFGSPLHDGQLDTALNCRKETNLISPGNSWGKTEYVAREAVRYCWFKLVHGTAYTSFHDWLTKDYRALVCSYQFDVAKESYQRLERQYDHGTPVTALVSRIIRSDPPKVEFSNGSVLDFGSLDQGGRHVEATRRQAIWVDEVGHMPDFRNIYRGILYPRTIGVQGVIWLLGTPKPQTDPWLYEVARDGENPDSYYSFRPGSSFENTFWPSSERVRILANPELFHQASLQQLHNEGLEVSIENLEEYGCFTEMGRQVVLGEFILAGGLYFNKAHVLRMFRGEHGFGLPTGSCVTAWDLGGSKKSADATVGITLDLGTKPWTVTRLEHLPGGTVDWEEKYALIEQCSAEDKPFVIGVDVTGGTGDSISEELFNRGLPIEPFHFGGSTNKKLDMLRNLQSRMEMWGGEGEGAFKGWLRFPNFREHPELEERKKEFDFYRLEDTKLTQDTVMATAMATKLAVDYADVEPLLGIHL